MNSLSSGLLAQLYCQNSNDPFLTLIELSHDTFPEPYRFVNNSVPIVSRGNTFQPFPVKITLPADDGESIREVALELDNISLELIAAFRSLTGKQQVGVKLEMILASMPDDVQMSLEELKIKTIQYNRTSIVCKLGLDDFLGTALTSESYTPSIYPGLF